MDEYGFFSTVLPVKDKELKTILISISKIILVEKNITFLMMGEREEYVRFLIEGKVRCYFINDAGKDTTVDFACRQGSALIGVPSIECQNSMVSMETLSDSKILSIPLAALMRVCERFPEAMDLYNALLIEMIKSRWDSRIMLYMKKAEDRYDWFLREYPGLINEVNHWKIASFLNITPVTLSRIRHERGRRKNEDEEKC